MTRDETVALFLGCEARRAETRAAALAEGKDEHDAENTAHEAAKAHWNAWAQAMIEEKKALESASLFLISREIQEYIWESGGNKETECWLNRSYARFSYYRFENRQPDKDNYNIYAKKNCLRFEGYIFPGYTDFSYSVFNDYTIFSEAIFHDNVSFFRAVFYQGAMFSRSSFNGLASFGRCQFKNAARFEGAIFKDGVSFSVTAHPPGGHRALGITAAAILTDL